MNLTFRGKDKPTDVLSFPQLGEDADPAVQSLGDLGVVARRVAVWETDEACAVAALAGAPGEPTVTLESAVVVDDR
jgi:ssRNA-specific RNase YbeY (16S rRNA maturation enzyme)